jgi:hypothetical protein
MSVQGHLSDVADARETVNSAARRHAASTAAIERLTSFLLSDSYAFTEIVCGHSDLIPEVHMPMSYAVCGLTDKLIWCLNESGFESEVTAQLREQFKARGLDPRRPEDRDGIDLALDWQHWVVTRGVFKSSVITHGGGTFTATVDPNTTAKIVHAKDDIAWDFCWQIAKTILSGTYRDLFPHRIPQGKLAEEVTSKHITLNGRTISHPQTTIQASGYLAKDIGAHYDRFWIDDLVVGGQGGNATDTELPGVHTFLRGLSGSYMLTRRVRQVHVGTRYHENDDYAGYTAKGKNRLRCLSVVLPIERHEGEVVNILERGTPTIPSLLPPERITELQARNMPDANDVDGAFMWRCNYLLDPAPLGGRMFSSKVVDDPLRSWMGPFTHPKEKQYPNRFLVARYARDAEGKIVDRDGKRLDRNADPAKGGKVFVWDPWKDLHVVMTLDPSWKEGGDNWAITVTGIDFEMVRFPLEVRTGTDGMEGWIEALAALDDTYQPRVVGFGGGGTQEEAVMNIIRTDKRLRKLRGRVVCIKEANESKKSRILNGVAEPLKRYKLLLPPKAQSVDEYDAGAELIREEMRAYRGAKHDTDGVIDSMSMVSAVLRVPRSAEDRKKNAERIKAREARIRRRIDPDLGVPYAA